MRTVLVVGGWTTPFGALSWLPAHLDAIGAGLAIATLQVTGRIAGLGRRAVVGPAVIAVGALLIAAAVLPRAVLVTSAGDVWLRGVLYVVVAAGVVVAVGDRPVGRVAASLAIAAPGLVLVGELAFVVIARQHVEGVADGPSGCASPGAAAAGVAVVDDDRRRHRRPADGARARPAPTGVEPGDGLASGTRCRSRAVVSIGLLVRVTTWLVGRPAEDRRRRSVLLPRHRQRAWPPVAASPSR